MSWHNISNTSVSAPFPNFNSCCQQRDFMNIFKVIFKNTYLLFINKEFI